MSCLRRTGAPFANLRDLWGCPALMSCIRRRVELRGAHPLDEALMQDFSDTLPQATLDLAEHPGIDDASSDLAPAPSLGWLERGAHAFSLGQRRAPTTHERALDVV